jgi:hypothetical protein
MAVVSVLFKEIWHLEKLRVNFMVLKIIEILNLESELKIN